MVAPLAGIRVLDIANWLAAPSAAALLGDLGADVIKVEPPNGDGYRSMLETMAPDATVLGSWENDNRSKRGITLDLEQPSAREVLLRLVQGVDIFITNFTRERVAKYGVTFEALRAVNPRLVYVQFSGYGSHGPDADRAGFDFLAFWARSGIEALIGEADSPPIPPMGGQGDHSTSLNILAATLVALRLRDQTGEAQRAEVTLQQTGLWTISNQVQTALIDGLQPPKNDRRNPRSPISNTYPTRDGRWVQFTMPEAERYWPRLCRALGEPEWITQYGTFALLTEHATVLGRAIEERLLQRDLAEWAERFDAERLLWAPVATLPEVIADPQLHAIGAFEDTVHPRGGPLRMVHAPFHIDGADIRVRRAAPTVGEHTFEVLSEAGIDADDIARYAAERAFG